MGSIPRVFGRICGYSKHFHVKLGGYSFVFRGRGVLFVVVDSAILHRFSPRKCSNTYAFDLWILWNFLSRVPPEYSLEYFGPLWNTLRNTYIYIYIKKKKIPKGKGIVVVLSRILNYWYWYCSNTYPLNTHIHGNYPWRNTLEYPG